jgi:hypothetical protein
MIKISFLPWLLAAWNCVAAQDTDAPGKVGRGKGAIRCYQVSCRLPHYNEQEQVDTFFMLWRRLYTTAGLMMYTFPYDDATGVGGVPTSSGTGMLYFVFDSNGSSGIRYDDHHPEEDGPFAIDSFKRSITPYLKQFGLFKKGIGRLVSAVSHAQTLKEIYCDINMEPHPNHDSCYVTYTDRLDFLPREMSLSYTMDSLYQRRLCDLKMVVTPRRDKQTNRLAGRSEWTWKLEELADFNRDSIQFYFSKYQARTF